MMRALLMAEAIKIRRHSATWFAVAAPVVAVGLFLITLFGQSPTPKMSPDAIWRALMRGGWTWWLAVFLPLLIALEAAALANLEHEAQQWKQLFAGPVPRWQEYAVKLLFCGGLVAASTLAFGVGLVADVLILDLFNRLNLVTHVPWADLAAQAGRAVLASLPMIAIQNWISLRYRGFAVSAGAGLALLLTGAFLAPVRPFHTKFWYPWTLPSFTVLTLESQVEDIHTAVVVGCVAGVVACAVVCWELARKREVS